MRSVLIYSELLSKYKLGENHPYDPVRVRRAYELCQRYGLLTGTGLYTKEPQPVSIEELGEVHDHRYLELLEEASTGNFFQEMLEYGLGTEECPVFLGLIDFARLCTGATLEAVNKVVDQGYDFAFNPMGGFHHAGRAMAEGFCYVNDICLVAKRYADKGLKVMVVDIDAHHGNGTQEFFYSDPRVLTVSFHESGETLYPFSGDVSEIGEGPGRGFNVNVPMLAGSDDEIFDIAFKRIFPPLIKAFSPDLVIGVMGVDTFSTDPLTHLNMTNNAYIQAAMLIQSLSHRWVALGAGGYNLDNVARSWTLLWATANGLDRDDVVLAGLGGVFMGDMDLGVSALWDKEVRTSGPIKANDLEAISNIIEYIRKHVFPILGAQ